MTSSSTSDASAPEPFSPVMIAVWYGLFGVLWIAFSDRVVAALAEDRQIVTLLQSLKGWLFVLASAVLIGLVNVRQHRARSRVEEARQRAERSALHEYRELVDRLAALERRVGVARDLTEVYRALRDFVQASGPCNGLLVSHYDPEKRQRVARYAFVEGQEEDVSVLPPMPMNESAHARAVRTGQVVVVDDRLVGAKERPTVDLGMDRDPRPARSSVAVPMIVEGRTIGAFEVQSVEMGAYTHEHVSALKLAANFAAIATQNVELLRREREARQEVEASEARFRSLIQNSGDIITLVDRDGTISYQSPSAQRILGYAPDRRVGRSRFELVHPDDLPRATAEAEEAMNAGWGQTTYRIRSADGEWRWFETSEVNLLHDPKVGACVLTSRDVTERKRAEEASRSAKSFNDAIIKSLPGVFYVIDADGRFVRWNRNFEQVLGYTEDEVARSRPEEIVEAGDGPDVREKIAEVFREGSATMEADLKVRDRGRVPYLFTGAKFSMGGETFLAGFGLDRTEISAARSRIQRLHEELKDRVERLTALREIDRAITGSLDLDHTLDVVLKQVTERLGVSAASVLLYRPASESLRFGASRGFRTNALRTTNLRLGEGQAGRVALEREPLRIDGREAFGRAFQHADGIVREGFRSYLAVPLVAKGNLQGVLEIFHREPLAASDDWHEFLDALATQTAIALDDATMFEHLQRSNQELRLAYDATIEGWARALDLRDEDTAGHSQRVTALTERLAERMGMCDAQLVAVRRGALLHDIGKMGVPDRILLKPGKLTADEWEEMKRHTTYAHDLLHPIGFLRSALDIPYCHHEKWDGTGYPRGLAGEEIPLAARIFAVVDVFDALTSDRPYRAAWTEERALQLIREESGKHFDPAVVRAFLELAEAEGGVRRSGGGHEGPALEEEGDDRERTTSAAGEPDPFFVRGRPSVPDRDGGTDAPRI